MITIVAYMAMSGSDAGDWNKSVWEVTVTADSGTVDQTWYIDIANNKQKIVSTLDADSLFVEENGSAGSSSYSLASSALKSNGYATWCAEESNMSDDACAANIANIDENIALAQTTPKNCESTGGGFSDNGADASQADGTLFGFSVKTVNGVPTEILTEDGATYATINSMAPYTGDIEFVGCDSRRNLSEEHHARNLGVLEDMGNWVTGSNWCGPGTTNSERGCPNSQADAACRKHDHCAFVEEGWVFPTLSCTCDYNAWQDANHWAVTGVYGQYGAMAANGCEANKPGWWSYGWGSCGWRGCNWQATSWNGARLTTYYGSGRYTGANLDGVGNNWDGQNTNNAGYTSTADDQCLQSSSCDSLTTLDWTGC